MLVAPKPGEPLFLYFSISKFAISSILFLECEGVQKPVYYVSKVLSDLEQNYSVAEKAVYALKEAFRRLHHYFDDRKIIVITSFPIREILSKPDAAGRVTKWALALSSCNFEFRSMKAIKGQAL